MTNFVTKRFNVVTNAIIISLFQLNGNLNNEIPLFINTTKYLYNFAVVLMFERTNISGK